MTSSFCAHKKTWRRTPDAGQNPGATKIPLPLRAGDKRRNYCGLSYRLQTCSACSNNEQQQTYRLQIWQGRPHLHVWKYPVAIVSHLCFDPLKSCPPGLAWWWSQPWVPRSWWHGAACPPETALSNAHSVHHSFCRPIWGEPVVSRWASWQVRYSLEQSNMMYQPLTL